MTAFGASLGNKKMAPIKGPFFRLHLLAHVVMVMVMVHMMMRMMVHHRLDIFCACD
jgi:hypothetical protein